MERRVLAVLLISLSLYGQTGVLTANYDNNRTSANLNEPYLWVGNVSPDTFGKLGTFPVSGQVYAQPLFAGDLNVPACGVCDVLFVATMTNNVYAFNANAPDQTEPLWTINLGTPVPSSSLGLRSAISPSVGILGTPVIDLGRNAIYLIAEILQAGKPVFQLHALDLSTGQDVPNSPVTIAAAVNGSGDASVNGRIALDSQRHLQRPGLLASNGRVYAAFGSVYDRAPYHGWVLGFDTGDLSLTAVFNTTPDGAAGGIWQSGRGLIADPDGSLYLGTGNGVYDGVTNFGESFLKLTPNLLVSDWFVPADWQSMSDVDLDTASLGPMLIPSLDMLLAGDKASNAYLIDRWNMGHMWFGNSAIPQVRQVVSQGGLFNSAVWDRSDGPIAYFVDQGAFTMAYRITDRQIEAYPFSWTEVTSDYPWQGMAISAYGDLDETGILWMTAGDHKQSNAPGTLLAYNAQDLTQLLWSSDMVPDRDQMGGFAKFATPTVANGMVFVPTLTNQVAVYGLLPLDTPERRTRTKVLPNRSK